MRTISAMLALLVVAGAWMGPLPDLAARSFSAHMTMHMAVVAVAAPLIALAVAGTAVDPVRVSPRLVAPIPASLLELVVVWAWHAPALHHAARHTTWALVLEQAMFMAAGLLVWIAAVGGDRETRRLRGGAGTVALLFTSMHMTLLGALFAVADRSLYAHGAGMAPASSLTDQHLGGAIMLLVGGASYMAGGLWLTAGMLRHDGPEGIERRIPRHDHA
jgi:putative membrane protein